MISNRKIAGSYYLIAGKRVEKKQSAEERKGMHVKKDTAKSNKKLNNAGMTLVEMITTFALLGIFMIAATRVISYVIGIYYAASGNSYGLQVSGMLSNKIIGQLEGACDAQTPTVYLSAGEIDRIKFTDSTGSSITISAAPSEDSENQEVNYLTLHYDEVSEGSIKYDAVDWRFDPKAYMGYSIKSLKFESPGSDYPENVVKMQLTLHHERYGDYVSTYYIKCIHVDKIVYKNEDV